MNSSTRTEPASGITPFWKLAAASLNETSLTFREKVENALSRVAISGWGVGGGAKGFLAGASCSIAGTAGDGMDMPACAVTGAAGFAKAVPAVAAVGARSARRLVVVVLVPSSFFLSITSIS